MSLTEGLKKGVPEILRETMAWLTSEVFDQEGDVEQAQVDEEQQAFEEAFDDDIKAAKDVYQQRRQLLRDELQRSASGVEDE